MVYSWCYWFIFQQRYASKKYQTNIIENIENISIFVFVISANILMAAVK